MMMAFFVPRTVDSPPLPWEQEMGADKKQREEKCEKQAREQLRRAQAMHNNYSDMIQGEKPSCRPNYSTYKGSITITITILVDPIEALVEEAGKLVAKWYTVTVVKAALIRVLLYSVVKRMDFAAPCCRPGKQRWWCRRRWPGPILSSYRRPTPTGFQPSPGAMVHKVKRFPTPPYILQN